MTTKTRKIGIGCATFLLAVSYLLMLRLMIWTALGVCFAACVLGLIFGENNE